MTKELFLKILKNGLNDFPEVVLGDILYDYKEKFDTGFASGKTEEEIIRELGNPQDIVNQYRLGYIQKSKVDDNYNSSIDHDLNYNDLNTTDDTIIHDIDYSTTETNDTNYQQNIKEEKPKDKRNTTNNSNNIILSIIIGILSLIIFGPFVFVGITVATAVGFALVTSSFAISLAGIVVLLAKVGINVIGFTNIPAFILDFPNSVIIWVIIGFTLLFIFLVFCLYYLLKVLLRLGKKFINFISNKFKEA